MPHAFIVKCYSAYHQRGKAKVGDVVYAKSRTDLPMHVVYSDPHCSYTAGKTAQIKVRYMKPDGEFVVAEFSARELSL